MNRHSKKRFSAILLLIVAGLLSGTGAQAQCSADGIAPPVDELLQAADRMVAALQAHDRQAWIDAFAQGAIVEDPLGSMRLAPDDFYDTFLATSQVQYVSHLDIAAGMAVARDITVTMTLKTGLAMTVDAHSLYEMALDNGQYKVCHVSACWEMAGMVKQFSSAGIKGLITTLWFCGNMIKKQGLRGLLVYMKGAATGISGKGHAAVESFAGAVESGDGDTLAALFDSQDPCVEFPAGSQMLKPRDFLASLAPGSVMTVCELTSAGWFTTCLFSLGTASSSAQGIAFFEFNPVTAKIKAVRLYRKE
jgi:hypothetical protein